MPIFTENKQVEKGLCFMPFDEHKLKIPLSPLPEQRRIAEILSTVDKKLERRRKRIKIE